MCSWQPLYLFCQKFQSAAPQTVHSLSSVHGRRWRRISSGRPAAQRSDVAVRSHPKYVGRRCFDLSDLSYPQNLRHLIILIPTNVFIISTIPPVPSCHSAPRATEDRRCMATLSGTRPGLPFQEVQVYTSWKGWYSFVALQFFF